ncbi:MAG TPA: SCO family protein [Candidatus Binatia bacterium]
MRHSELVALVLLASVVAARQASSAESAPFAGQPSRAVLKPGDESFGLTANDRPESLREVGFDQYLDAQVPRDIRLRDENGREVRLGDYLTDKPVILSLAYFSCPMLCDLHQQGLASSLKPLSFSAGKEFEVLTVSFDPRDTPEVAREKKQHVLARYDREGAADGWHFLTGDAGEIERLTRAVGFRYQYDEKRGEFAHPAGLVMLTPDGRIARYFFGLEFSPRDLRLGLVETTQRKIGNVVDQVLLFCFHYDPAMGRYSAVALNSVRVAGALTVLALVGLIGGALLREGSRRRAERHGASA